jgi:hypothetical protein
MSPKMIKESIIINKISYGIPANTSIIIKEIIKLIEKATERYFIPSLTSSFENCTESS